MKLISRIRPSVRLMLVAAAVATFVATSSLVSAQAGPWKQLFNGTDFTNWTILAGGGGRAGTPAPTTPPSTNPAERGWKVENGAITSTAPAAGQRSGSLATVDKYKDFEFETDFMLAEAPTEKCTPKLGDKQVNLSEDRSCAFNSGIYFRTGYQLNLGRREAGEYIGVVVHRTLPEAIRGNVDWLSTGDCGAKNHTYLQDCDQFKPLRKKGDWNHLRIMFQGTRLQIWLNGTQITDVTDDPTDPAEATWKDAAPIWFQTPPAGESGGFAGFIKHKNVRVRAL